MQERAHATFDQARPEAGDMSEGARLEQLKELTREHPLTAVAAALGAGMVVGIATGGGKGRETRDEDRGPGLMRRAGGGLASQTSGKSLEKLTDVVGSEISLIAQDLIRGLMEGGIEASDGGGDVVPEAAPATWEHLPPDRQLPQTGPYPGERESEWPAGRPG
jgi:hypothetical protein